MSKYTTEVRFICESKAGLSESTGSDNVDDIVSKSWDKIFTSKAIFFDESYRAILCQKILKHYYLREIGSETVGIWKLWMNTRLEEIMPFYNQLYKSALIEFNPLYDVDLKRTHNRKIDSSKQDTGTSQSVSSGEINASGTSSGSSNNTKKDLYSDTPQGAITGLENENYLTNARKVTDTGSTSNENSSTGTNKTTVNDDTSNTGTANSLEDYVENVSGKQGSESYSSMLLKFRETFLNIDMQVIEEFSDLFMGLW
jgi:hypothetical protein